VSEAAQHHQSAPTETCAPLAACKDCEWGGANFLQRAILETIDMNRFAIYALAILTLVPAVASDAPQARAESANIVTIRQVSSGRLLTAERVGDKKVVTSAAQNWTWYMTSQGGDVYTFHQTWMGTGQRVNVFLDAHEIAEKDFHLVMRTRQTFDRTQLWKVVAKGNGIFTIMQVSSGRFMDAHEIPAKNFGVVSRPKQEDATQLWVITRRP